MLRFHEVLCKIALIGFSIGFSYLAANLRGQSANDGFDLGLSTIKEDVQVIVVQPDGKILIGGEFATVLGVSRSGMARINPDGTLDMAFAPNIVNPASGHPTVLAIALEPDGKVLVGGGFTSAGGQQRHGFARLDPVTGAADSFDPNPNNGVGTIALQNDGKILVGGGFTTIHGQARSHIARLDPATGIPDAFDPSVHSQFENSTYVFALVPQPDGKILVGGYFNSVAGQTRNHMARLDPTTGLPDSFNPNASDQINAIAVQPDSRIVVGGYFTTIGGQSRIHMARLDPVTGLADSLNPSPNARLLALALQPDGGIVVSGLFVSIDGMPRNLIARVDPITGAADSFDPSASGSDVFPILPSVSALAVQADGKVLAGGGFIYVNPNGGPQITRKNIVRLEKNGFADQTLNLNIVGPLTSFIAASAVQPDGKLLIGGTFSSVLGVARNNIARLNTDGSLDTGFNPNANNEVDAIAVQADGKILVGGFFNGANSVGGQPRNYIARLDAVTGLADSFNPNSNNVVQAIAVQTDGKIVVGGLFSGANSIGGATRNRIARLDATTGLADGFNPSANGNVFSIIVQLDGKILVGGAFNGANSIGGATRNRIARLDGSSGLADTFDPNANGTVFSIALQTDGKILAAGAFNGANSIGGQTRNRIARLDPATGTADSFDPNANSLVESIAVQADGKILAGGFFNGANSIGGAARNRIARLDANTGLADSFDPNANGNVFSIALQSDGKILVGGTFSGANSIGGQSRDFFARLTNDTSASQDLSASSTTVTWSRGGASAVLSRVTFEYSTDNAGYSPLGNGLLSGSDWMLTGLNLPNQQNFYIRARGFYRTGKNNGSESVAESVRNVFLSEVSVANVVSRKVHGAAGTFDINLPRSGNPGIECRSGGMTGDYQLVFSFTNPITSVGEASVTSGTGNIASRMIDTDAHNYIVNLTGVTNAQTISIKLTNVNDNAGNSSSSVSVPMSILIGDVTGNGSVNASDIAQTKTNSGAAIDATNFRSDTNANGSINASDIALVKTKSGTALPSPQMTKARTLIK